MLSAHDVTGKISRIFSMQSRSRIAICAEVLDGFALLTRRNCRKLDYWYFATVALFPFLFAYLIINGYNISAKYVVGGIVIYNGVWYGTLAAMLIDEDKHKGFLTYLKLAPISKTIVYALSLISITFFLCCITSVSLLMYFHVNISVVRAMIVSCLASLISLATGALLSRKISSGTVFNNTLNIIFLVFTYQTVIPVTLPILLYTNPLYYIGLIIR